MALRFRRSIKLAPGVRLNLGKKSASVRVGPRGAGITAGSAGKRISGGLPGTGLHFTKAIGRRQLASEGPNAAQKSGSGKLIATALIFAAIAVALTLIFGGR